MNTQVTPVISSEPRSTKGGAHLPVLACVAFFAVIVGLGAAPRVERASELNNIRQELTVAIPAVPATIARAADKVTTLLLPGDTQPIQNIPIYARANGFLHERKVDIGDNVKAGQVLAVIETPELDEQLEQARANLRMAEASVTTALSDRQNYAAQLFAARATIKQNRTNLEFSNTEFGRYADLASQGAVSFEERDRALKALNSDRASVQISRENEKAALAQVVSADARIAAAKQSVESNQHNVEQLKAMQGFKNVIAPSDGVITNRFVDAGALVAAGGSTGTTELLTMARTDVLRIYVDVPQSDYRYIHVGNNADILLQEFPNKVFSGTVTNIAGSLNSNSRTLQTEIRIANLDHVLRPGSYAQVRFVFDRQDPPVIIPSSAAVTRDTGLFAAVVNAGKVRFQRLDVARDYGNKLEIVGGLKANDVVLLDPPDSLSDGASVKALMQPLAVATSR